MRRRDFILGASSSALALSGCATAPNAAPLSPRARRPLIIAHRGASGERPEHTMAAYQLAIEQGADFIEPDLVLTRDGHLICRHDNELSRTTDIADRREFRLRRTTKQVDGVETEGWFSEDFTLEELKTLYCREPLAELRPENSSFNEERIPTLMDVFELARDQSAALGRTIGLYPEMKHPTHFLRYNLIMTDKVRDFLRANGLDRRDAPVFVQCFEEQPLRSLKLQDVRTPLSFLMSAAGGPYDRMAAQRAINYPDYLAGPLQPLREFADVLAVEKTLIVPRDAANAAGAPTDLIARAHIAGLGVHAWTFRAENYFLPPEHRRGDPTAADFQRQHGDLAGELQTFAQLGVDGVFTDFPALVAAAFG
ncbi:MAG: glycerophosphodiester phosphodiesterase family protein [Hyphomonadaceae bacterium]